MLEKLCKRILAIENVNKNNFIELCLNHDAAHFESLKWSDFIWREVYHDFCFHITINVYYLTSLQLLLPIKINPFICWLSLHPLLCLSTLLCLLLIYLLLTSQPQPSFISSSCCCMQANFLCLLALKILPLIKCNCINISFYIMELFKMNAELFKFLHILSF